MWTSTEGDCEVTLWSRVRLLLLPLLSGSLVPLTPVVQNRLIVSSPPISILTPKSDSFECPLSLPFDSCNLNIDRDSFRDGVLSTTVDVVSESFTNTILRYTVVGGGTLRCEKTGVFISQYVKTLQWMFLFVRSYLSCKLTISFSYHKRPVKNVPDLFP